LRYAIDAGKIHRELGWLPRRMQRVLQKNVRGQRWANLNSYRPASKA
jgi:dTDP-D-glucose 4,6-dehydratase